MSTIRIDEGLKSQIIEIINLNHLQYPTLKSFVDKAVQEKINQSQHSVQAIKANSSFSFL